MITLKYNKCGAMAFISHIDLLRHIVRAIRRTGFPVKFSEGFNPHMLINLGVPLPLGMNSSAEYVTINTDTAASLFLEKYNEVAPETLRATAAYDVLKNPNFAGKIVAADYSIKHKGAVAFKNEIENIINMKEYIIKYPSKKNPQGVKDIIPYLYGLKVYEDTMIFCIAAGNETLRADKLAEALAETFGFTADVSEIWKYNQYLRDKLLINADETLKNP
ncbi:MAG: DUF2344 domain-containing protein [Clostridia bacterium]|nr:DUF2344 domain-containing protein [Clostridia bacterium]